MSPEDSSPHAPARRTPWRLAGATVALGVALVLARLLLSHGWEYEQKLAGDYLLLATDVREQMNVSQLLPNGDAVGVIPATVFAVGWNDEFIIARQRAPADGRQGPASFYLLRVPDGALWGPLTAEQFAAERLQQQVPASLDFTLVLDDLR